MQGPKLCTKPRHFCNLDMAIFHHFTCVCILGKYVLCNQKERTLLYLKSYFKIEIFYMLTTSKYNLNLHEYVVCCTDWFDNFLLISGRYHWGRIDVGRPWSYLQWLYHATWIYRFFAQRSGIDQCIDQKNNFESTTCI